MVDIILYAYQKDWRRFSARFAKACLWNFEQLVEMCWDDQQFSTSPEDSASMQPDRKKLRTMMVDLAVATPKLCLPSDLLDRSRRIWAWHYWWSFRKAFKHTRSWHVAVDAATSGGHNTDLVALLDSDTRVAGWAPPVAPRAHKHSARSQVRLCPCVLLRRCSCFLSCE